MPHRINAVGSYDMGGLRALCSASSSASRDAMNPIAERISPSWSSNACSPEAAGSSSNVGAASGSHSRDNLAGAQWADCEAQQGGTAGRVDARVRLERNVLPLGTQAPKRAQLLPADAGHAVLGRFTGGCALGIFADTLLLAHR